MVATYQDSVSGTQTEKGSFTSY